MNKNSYSKIFNDVLDILKNGNKNETSGTDSYVYLIILELISVNIPMRRQDIIDIIRHDIEKEKNELILKIIGEEFNEDYFDEAFNKLISNDIVFHGNGYLAETKQDHLILKRNEFFYIAEISEIIERLTKINIVIENKEKLIEDLNILAEGKSEYAQGWKIFPNHIQIGKEIKSDTKLKEYRCKLIEKGKHLRIIASYGGWLTREPFCEILEKKRLEDKNVNIEVITDTKPIGGSALFEWDKCHKFMEKIGCKSYVRFFPKLKLNMLISDDKSAIFFDRNKFSRKMIGARFIEKKDDGKNYIKDLIDNFDEEKKFSNIIKKIFFIIRNEAYEKNIDFIALIIAILIGVLFGSPLGAIVSVGSLFIAFIIWAFIEIRKNGIF